MSDLMAPNSVRLGTGLADLAQSPLPGGAIGHNYPAHEWVSPEEFPDWFFVEVIIGNEFRVASIFHVKTPAGKVPYWYEDPENQHRGLPLLTSMKPELLGDYGSFLEDGNNMKLFVALCKSINDLPDPLLAVQAIRWINRRQLDLSADLQSVASQAINSVTQGIKRRRREFEHVMNLIMGGSKPAV